MWPWIPSSIHSIDNLDQGLCYFILVLPCLGEKISERNLSNLLCHFNLHDAFVFAPQVTEFAPLRSLAENIKQEALKASFPVTLLVEFSVQIADAMRYLHSSNIIHRDLATRNILLFINEVVSKWGIQKISGYVTDKVQVKFPVCW